MAVSNGWPAISGWSQIWGIILQPGPLSWTETILRIPDVEKTSASDFGRERS